MKSMASVCNRYNGSATESFSKIGSCLIQLTLTSTGVRKKLLLRRSVRGPHVATYRYNLNDGSHLYFSRWNDAGIYQGLILGLATGTVAPTLPQNRN
jgi:hypothetical protein